MLVIYLTHGGTREEVDSIISFESTTGGEFEWEMDGEAGRGGITSKARMKGSYWISNNWTACCVVQVASSSKD